MENMKISPVSKCPAPLKYLWNNNYIYKFQQALQLPSVTSKLDQSVHSVYSLDQDSIDVAVNDFPSCITEAANIALKQKKAKVSGKKEKDKPWYNTSLHDMKNPLISIADYLLLTHLAKSLELNVFI